MITINTLLPKGKGLIKRLVPVTTLAVAVSVIAPATMAVTLHSTVSTGAAVLYSGKREHKPFLRPIFPRPVPFPLPPRRHWPVPRPPRHIPIPLPVHGPVPVNGPGPVSGALSSSQGL